MRASAISRAIARNHRINRPMMLWGPPGVGKSSLFHQYAKEEKLPILDWRLTIMDSVDMRGTPRAKDGLTYWLPPAELPRDGEGILFLDELAQARPDVKNAAAMLVLERRIGDYRLPPGWWVAAASNRLSDASGTTPMPQHLNNRFWHCEFTLSVEDWLIWADAHEIDYRTYAYIKYKPEALLDFDPKSKEPAFASPRSWELCSDLIKDLDKSGRMMTDIEPEERADVFGGCVGRARGDEFSGFLQVMDSLVSIEQVFAAPATAPLPNDPSVCYALVVALAMHAKRDNLPAARQYVKRLPGEFSVVLMHSIEKRNPTLMKSKSFVELSVELQASL